MVMDYKKIEDFWFGEIETPEFPLEPLELGISFPEERMELVNPLELEFQPIEEPEIVEEPETPVAA